FIFCSIINFSNNLIYNYYNSRHSYKKNYLSIFVKILALLLLFLLYLLVIVLFYFIVFGLDLNSFLIFFIKYSMEAFTLYNIYKYSILLILQVIIIFLFIVMISYIINLFFGLNKSIYNSYIIDDSFISFYVS